MEQELPPLPPRYRCIEHLGDGATGHVYRARDMELDDDVAVKVVRPNLAVHARFRARFAREVALLAQVVHPHVVPVHDLGVTPDDLPFVALAYANGGNLRTLLARGVALDTLLRTMEEVCLALAALHARGIIHQDLKPANVLLHQVNGRLTAWVADLGVADDLAELARDARRVGGTPSYMAPEQLQGRPQEVGPWTDLYALGIMLYESLAGQRPHPGEGRRELLKARLEAPPPLQPREGLRLDPALIRLVACLLDPEPRQRFDRAADVRRVLARVRADITRRRRQDARATEPPTTAGFETFGPRPDGRGASLGLRWNQVTPDPMPEEPPDDEGLSAPARASLALFALRELPLVARERPRRLVWQAAREVAELRQPRVVVVVGEPGAGKSRLVESVARGLDEGGWMEVVRLRYHTPPGPDDGYRGAARELLAPWNDTRLDLQGRLARWLARDRGAPLTDVLQEAGMLARWCGYLLPGERAPNAALGLSLLYRHLAARAWRGGACLVLEDVHHAESGGDGLGIAEAILDGAIGTFPALVLCTISADSLREDPKLLRRLEGLQERGAVRIGLPRLTREETGSLLTRSLRLEPDLADRLVRLVEGRPLHAGMLLRDWVARGALVPGPGMRFRLADGVSLEQAIPPDLETLYRRRLEAAIASAPNRPAAAEALAAVVLAGQAPPAAVVRHVSVSGLDALLASGVLRQSGGLLYFEHGALRHAALARVGDLAPPATIHQKLADAWADLGRRTGLDVELPLGMHLLRSGHPAEALEPLLRAVRAMLEQGRAHAAVRGAELAITAADLAPHPGVASAALDHLARRQDARRLKAAALLEADEPAACVQVVREALDLGTVDALSRARLVGLMGRAHVSLQEWDTARELLQEARTVFTQYQDTEGLADIAFGRARLAERAGRISLAAGAYAEVLQLRPSQHRQAVLARAGLIQLDVLLGRSDRAAAEAATLLEVAEGSGDTRSVAQAFYSTGFVRIDARELEGAEEALRLAQGLAAMAGDDRMQLDCLNSLGEVARFRGKLSDARARYERYARLARVREYPEATAIGHINLGLLDLQANAFSAAEEHATEAAEALESRPRHYAWVYVGLLLAACAARTRQLQTARHWWQVAVERGLEELSGQDLWIPLVVLAAESGRNGWEDLERSARVTLQRVRRDAA